MNFHSTSIGAFDGQWRLFLPADKNEQVAVVTLEGKLEYVLRRPEFEEYQAEDVPYKPTDTLLVGNQLYIADGYGSNYILSADVTTRQWMNIFGGKTEGRKRTRQVYDRARFQPGCSNATTGYRRPPARAHPDAWPGWRFRLIAPIADRCVAVRHRLSGA